MFRHLIVLTLCSDEGESSPSRDDSKENDTVHLSHKPHQNSVSSESLVTFETCLLMLYFYPFPPPPKVFGDIWNVSTYALFLHLPPPDVSWKWLYCSESGVDYKLKVHFTVVQTKKDMSKLERKLTFFSQHWRKMSKIERKWTCFVKFREKTLNGKRIWTTVFYYFFLQKHFPICLVTVVFLVSAFLRTAHFFWLMGQNSYPLFPVIVGALILSFVMVISICSLTSTACTPSRSKRKTIRSKRGKHKGSESHDAHTREGVLVIYLFPIISSPLQSMIYNAPFTCAFDP